MAPKRKEAPTEPTRRSSRSVPNSAAAAKEAPAAPSKPKSAGSKAVPKDEVAKKADEPAAEKKAKTSHATPVGEVVKDVVLKNGSSPPPHPGPIPITSSLSFAPRRSALLTSDDNRRPNAENDEEVSFASAYKDSGIVLFSYPKANTPGCTNQACGYRDIYDEIKKTGYQVYGISADSPKSQMSWKTSKKLQYSFFCDPKKTLLSSLGATEAQKRCHWVIEKGGKLLEAKIGVKPADDPGNALKFIKAL